MLVKGLTILLMLVSGVTNSINSAVFKRSLTNFGSAEGLGNPK